MTAVTDGHARGSLGSEEPIRARVRRNRVMPQLWGLWRWDIPCEHGIESGGYGMSNSMHEAMTSAAAHVREYHSDGLSLSATRAARARHILRRSLGLER